MQNLNEKVHKIAILGPKQATKNLTVGLSFLKHVCMLVAYAGKQPLAPLIFWLLSVGLKHLLIHYIALVAAEMVPAILKNDKNVFLNLICIASMLLVSLGAVVGVQNYFKELFTLRIRYQLTIRLSEKMLSDSFYFLAGVCEDFDQIICDDVEQFSIYLASTMSQISFAPVLIVLYSYLYGRETSAIPVIIIFVFFLCGAILLKLSVDPVVNLIVEKKLFEGSYRYLNVLLRKNVESITFCRGQSLERTTVKDSIYRLIRKMKQIARFDSLAISLQNLVCRTADLLPYIFAAVYYYKGKFDHLEVDKQIVSMELCIFYGIQLVDQFTSILDLTSGISNLAGHTSRVYNLKKLHHPVRKNFSTDNDYFAVSGVDVTTPNYGRVLVKNLSVSVEPGNHLLIMGPSGSGKTAILRAIFGIWEVEKGGVTLCQDYIVIPAVPVFSNGSLLDQIAYPRKITESAEVQEQLDSIIEKLGLQQLVLRMDGYFTFHFLSVWITRMSPGEAQRIMLGRVLFHKPKFVFLDEACNKISVKREDKLLKELKGMGITIIKITNHRRSLVEFKQLLELDGKGGYTLIKL